MSKSLPRIIGKTAFVALPVILAIVIWGIFISLPQSFKRDAGQSVSLYPILAEVAVMLGLIINIVIFRNKIRVWLLGLGFLVSFSAIVTLFSLFYWLDGSTLNFNVELSKLDAIYFAVGTLSTAGTGNIAATSEAARALQTMQMIVDFGLILVAAGILVGRLASSNSESPSDP